MELAAHDARPVPTEVSRKHNQSKGPGASANPADVVLTTRAVSLILDSRAKIPGKSSARSFISFHCFSSFVSFPTSIEASIIEADSSSITSSSFGFLDKDRLEGETGFISYISALA